MTRRLAIRPRAVRDIDDHAAYLAREASPRIANRFHEALEAVFAQIEETPELGSPWESTREELRDIRFWILQRFRNHVVFFRFTDAAVEIVRILHGSRDLEQDLLDDQG